MISSSGEPGKSNTLFLFSPDVFPTDSACKASDPRKCSVEYCESMDHAIKWMARHRQRNSIVLCFDGRSHITRRRIEDIFYEVEGDENKIVHGIVTFCDLASGSRDCRFPKRRIFAWSHNHESFLALLPVAKTRFQTLDRTHYDGSKETSTMVTSYSNVRIRPLKCIPRASKQDKESISGMAEPTYEEVLKVVATK